MNTGYDSLCACGHLKGRHQVTNLGHVTGCSDCGCKGFVSCAGFPPSGRTPPPPASQNPPQRAGHRSADWIERAAADIRDLNPDYHDFETEVARIIRGLAPPPASVQQLIADIRRVAGNFEKVATFDDDDGSSILGHSASRVLESFAAQLAALYAPQPEKE